jgi:fucose permease
MGTGNMCSVKMTILIDATMAIMALTIILTAYQYHEYCFFTLKNRMAQFKP